MPYDLVTEADTGKRYCKKFILWPKYWNKYSEAEELVWKHIKYSSTTVKDLPDKPGVYAFVVKPGIAGLVECNYLLYIGKAQDQTLKVRCKQYLNENKKRKPRILIAQMFNLWREHLFLYYAELDSVEIDINNVEENLLAAFLPPLNSTLPGKLTSISKDIYRS